MDEQQQDGEAGTGEQAPGSGATTQDTSPPDTDSTEEQEAPPTYTADVEQTGPCARLLRFDVSHDRVQQEIDDSYKELRQTVFIKGFRKGHVPRHILERRFGEQVLDGVKQALVDEHFATAVDEHSLRLALQPDIQYDDITLTPGQPLHFEINVEIVPEFTIDNYKGIEVERPPVDVTQDQVDQHLEAFRMRHGQYDTIPEGQAEETDVPVCHAIALHDGNEIWRRDELGAHIADETIGGLPVPGLRDALLGAKPGDSKTLKCTLPDEFPEEEHRGKEVDLEITVDELRRFTVPDATDEWAQSVNFDSLEDLREELEDELRREHEQAADDAVQERIADRLLQLAHFDVPEGLVDRLTTGAKERQRLALLYRGLQPDRIDALLTEQDATRRESSIRHCKLYFIYEKVAEQEKIFVTEDETQQRIQAIALNYRRRPEEVLAELEEQDRLPSLRQQMREEKVRDYLVQHADIHEAPPADTPAPPDEPDPGATTVVEPPPEEE